MGLLLTQHVVHACAAELKKQPRATLVVEARHHLVRVRVGVTVRARARARVRVRARARARARTSVRASVRAGVGLRFEAPHHRDDRRVRTRLVLQ